MDKTEELIYEMVGKEIENKEMVSGIYTKAFSIAGGNPQKTLAEYIKIRVHQIRLQMAEASEKEEEVKRKKIEIEKEIKRQQLEKEKELKRIYNENITFCNDCKTRMSPLYWQGQPSNEYQCKRCLKRVTIQE